MKKLTFLREEGGGVSCLFDMLYNDSIINDNDSILIFHIKFKVIPMNMKQSHIFVSCG